MIIYHHNDMDGRCAAAIAAKWAAQQKNPTPPVFVEMDYNRTVDVSMVKPGDIVVIVDFSFKPADMNKLAEADPGRVIWIDHHKTAQAYAYGADLDGLRDFAEKGQAGCELAWRFFFPELSIPRGVFLIGDYDAWRLVSDPDCFKFFEGMKLCDTSAASDIWHHVMNGNERFIEGRLADGATCIRYRDSYCSDFRGTLGYRTEIDGVEAYACNLYRFGSGAFGKAMDTFPLCIAYAHDGEKFICSLYSTRPDVDVSEIAKAHGGGGHKGAAGFVCKELPFGKGPKALPPATVE